MNLLENLLPGFGSQEAVDQLAQRFGLEPNQVNAVMAAAAPHVASGMQQKLSTAEDGENAQLQDMMNDQSLQRAGEDGQTAADPVVHSQGESLLSHIFGGGEGVSSVAGAVASRSGVSQGTVQMLLPAITAMLAGTLARHSGGNGGQMAQILGAIAGGNAQAQTATGGGLLGALENAAGGLFRR